MTTATKGADLDRRMYALGPTALAEYFLGAQGESCTAACTRLGKFCDARMDLGDDTEAMLRHLNI